MCKPGFFASGLPDAPLLSADLQVGEQAAVGFIQGAVKPRFFSATGFKDGLSVLIGYSNAELLNNHSPGIRQPKNFVAEFESHDRSISVARLIIAVRKQTICHH
jgi:hypothetical protein